MSAKRLLSIAILLVSAASLAMLFAAFADTGALLGGDPLRPLVNQVAADMEERSRLHNERNERTFALAEQTVERFCGGSPVFVVEVYEDDETALVSHDDERLVVGIGVHRRPEDPAAYRAFWPQPEELWEIEASVRGPVIVRKVEIREVAVSAK